MNRLSGNGFVLARWLSGALLIAGLMSSLSVLARPDAASTLNDGPLRVALYRGPGTGGKGPTNLLQQLNRKEMTIREVTPGQIQTGALTNFDVVIFAGGSASKQASAIGTAGREAVCRFVGQGGGYIGICAGAYLATSGFSWSLNLINAKTVSSKWQRGRGDVQIELTDHGRQILGHRSGSFPVHYANGPVVAPAQRPLLPEYQPWAFFRTELAAKDTPVGVMVNSPAIFAADYGAGRVICISPHPEQTAGLEEFVSKAATWAAAKHPPAPSQPAR